MKVVGLNRSGLPRAVDRVVSRAIGLIQLDRKGSVIKVGRRNVEFSIEGTPREGESDRSYIGRLTYRSVMDWDGECSCPCYLKRQIVWGDKAICKHLWWCAIKCSAGEVEPLREVSLFWNRGGLHMIVLNQAVLRTASGEMEQAQKWLQTEGLTPERQDELLVNGGAYTATKYTR